MFNDESISLLGESPICTVFESESRIHIDLGSNPTIVEGDVL